MPPITPYSIAKMAEASEHRTHPELGPMIRRHIKEDWTIAKVGAMTTAGIEDQLRSYGVEHNRELFLSLARHTYSAWAISEWWSTQNRLNCRGKEEDFIGLAACELWKRWLPEHPSVEMLDDWMQEGYQLLSEHKTREACDLWWKVWRTLYERFSPGMNLMSETYEVFAGLQSLYNWCQDFEGELHNAALEGPEYDRRSHASGSPLLART